MVSEGDRCTVAKRYFQSHQVPFGVDFGKTVFSKFKDRYDDAKARKVTYVNFSLRTQAARADEFYQLEGWTFEAKRLDQRHEGLDGVLPAEESYVTVKQLSQLDLWWSNVAQLATKARQKSDPYLLSEGPGRGSDEMQRWLTEQTGEGIAAIPLLTDMVYFDMSKWKGDIKSSGRSCFEFFQFDEDEFFKGFIKSRFYTDLNRPEIEIKGRESWKQSQLFSEGEWARGLGRLAKRHVHGCLVTVN